MDSKKRVDILLFEKGLAKSRTHAKELVDSGQVYLVTDGKKSQIKKSNVLIDESRSSIFVDEGPANRFVSRGGLKLEGALEKTGLSVSGIKVLDVGISTGGFTDCLLQSGAQFVLGVDVGHGQVNQKLLSDNRLAVLEGVNARSLSLDENVKSLVPTQGFDLIVMDVSFISIELIIPQFPNLLKSGGYLLSLVKPQFEVGVDGLSKGGIVKDSSLYVKVEEKVKHCCTHNGFKVLQYFASSIEGKDGNHEFFVFAQKI